MCILSAKSAPYISIHKNRRAKSQAKVKIGIFDTGTKHKYLSMVITVELAAPYSKLLTVTSSNMNCN
uniref:Uncharacterized protein n=1 Tax=Arundo donax TaxID=35708 RepID=A0A0A9DKW6_ARUDO